MPCTVKKTFEAARDTGNFIIAQVKANQQTLHDTIEAICAVDLPADSAETVDRNRHGRQEHRLIETFDVTGRLGPDWDGRIIAAARVTRLTRHRDTTSGLWHPTNETSFFACQIRLSATAIGAALRPHWGLENRSHYVRDVTFFEDRSRIRKNRATSPDSAPSPSTSFAPTVPTTSAGNFTSMRSIPITPCHTGQRKEN